MARSEQLLHLGALSLVAVSAAIIMVPAAYHRIHGARLCSASSAIAAAIFCFMAYMWYLLPRTNGGRDAAT